MGEMGSIAAPQMVHNRAHRRFAGLEVTTRAIVGAQKAHLGPHASFRLTDMGVSHLAGFSGILGRN